MNEHKDHQHNHEASAGEPLHHRAEGQWNGPKRGRLLGLHDNLTGLFLDPCGVIVLLKLLLHIIGSLLNFL